MTCVLRHPHTLQTKKDGFGIEESSHNVTLQVGKDSTSHLVRCELHSYNRCLENNGAEQLNTWILYNQPVGS